MSFEYIILHFVWIDHNGIETKDPGFNLDLARGLSDDTE